MSQSHPLPKDRFFLIEDIIVRPESLSISGEISSQSLKNEQNINIKPAEFIEEKLSNLDNNRRVVWMNGQKYELNQNENLILCSFEKEKISEVYWKTAPNKIKFWIIQDAPDQISIVSDQDWNAGQETLYLYSIPHLVEDILKSCEELLDEMLNVNEIHWD